MSAVREPAVAGLFYPLSGGECGVEVERLLGTASAHDQSRPALPKALIVPHAGYVYSGEIAASAYALLAARAGGIERVVLLGPNHRVALTGIALPAADVFRTPLGDVAIDTRSRNELCTLPWVGLSDKAHRDEHCLEVQLPFLQRVLGAFRLLPMVVGDCAPEHVATALSRVWGGAETLIVLSTDLSHYLSYEEARERDARTSAHIEALEPVLNGGDACGCRALNGLLLAAGERGMRIARLDLRNSGDTAGTHQRVVGYGAWRVD